MKSLWSDEEAAGYEGDLGLRVYTSRLLGRDKSLVLHGGGNTSVKIREKNLFGDEEIVFYVKGSGWDLETIEPRGFSPLRLAQVLRLAELPALSDPEMVKQFSSCLLETSAPRPSLETFLHGCLPWKFVDHTHADAVLAISNTRDGEARTRELYGEQCVVVPYLKPGFGLARISAEAYAKQKTAKTIGMVLLNHGIVSFGESVRESYERMIELVSRAEAYLSRHGAWEVVMRAPEMIVPDPLAQAKLRRSISDAASHPVIMKTCTTARTLGFARHPGIRSLSKQGPITPDHVIWTKRLPMLGTDVAGYAEEYRRYFETHARLANDARTMIDPAPRLAIDPAFGLAAIGRTARDADTVEELYDHSIDTMLRAEVLGGFRALPAKDIFDVEYWDLEQAKLEKRGTPPVFEGEVALVTGAASGIGKAAVVSLLARGAAVIGFDLNPAVESLHLRPDFLGIRCDVTDEQALAAGLGKALLRFGGLDMLVLNAGIFSAARKISELATGEWRKVMNVNLDANLFLLRAGHPYLKLAPRGGRVVVIGSKNVPAPGPGASAYSASKAALNQLARVAALEWGADGIRINSLHPNAVFDTGLWTEDVLLQRARHYGVSVEQYKKNNVLQVEVTSRDVAELAAEMCGPLFAKTTGAQVPVDGGNERVI